MDTPHTKKKAWWIRPFIVISMTICLIFVILSGIRSYFRLPVSSYYMRSEKAFTIPATDDGFVAQGIFYDERADGFFVTGYTTASTASPVYIVDKTEGTVRKTVYLCRENGEPFCGNAGGIAAAGAYVYLAGGEDACVYAFPYAAFFDVPDGGTVVCCGKLLLAENEPFDVSCVAVTDGILYVGECVHKPESPALPSHTLTVGEEEFHAICVSFALADGEGTVCGINPAPRAVYAIPDDVQGVCFHDGKFYLSTSRGLEFSHIFVYDAQDLSPSGTFALCGVQVPRYLLGKNALVRTIKLPPMAEEIVIVEGKLYTMCPSASNKYLFGKLTDSRWCYGYELEPGEKKVTDEVKD